MTARGDQLFVGSYLIRANEMIVRYTSGRSYRDTRRFSHFIVQMAL